MSSLSPGQKREKTHSNYAGKNGRDQDGEVLNAARAIRRLLESERLTFADLTRLVSGGEVTAVERHMGIPEMADLILRRVALNAKEKRFVQSIMTQATLMPGFRMSEKQARWFGFLYDRAS